MPSSLAVPDLQPYTYDATMLMVDAMHIVSSEPKGVHPRSRPSQLLNV